MNTNGINTTGIKNNQKCDLSHKTTIKLLVIIVFNKKIIIIVNKKLGKEPNTNTNNNKLKRGIYHE